MFEQEFVRKKFFDPQFKWFMSGNFFWTLVFNVRKIFFKHPPPPPPRPRSPKFLGKIVAKNKNLLQGIIGFDWAILADTLQIKRG
jgi:hypothetical protein